MCLLRASVHPMISSPTFTMKFVLHAFVLVQRETESLPRCLLPTRKRSEGSKRGCGTGPALQIFRHSLPASRLLLLTLVPSRFSVCLRRPGVGQAPGRLAGCFGESVRLEKCLSSRRVQTVLKAWGHITGDGMAPDARRVLQSPERAQRAADRTVTPGRSPLGWRVQRCPQV